MAAGESGRNHQTIREAVMKKNKLERFAELEILHNVVQKNNQYKGKWAADFFKNNLPLTLELACGKGEYTVALAKKFLQKNS